MNPNIDGLIAYDMALDCDEPCNNDLDPTEPHPADFRDWWTGQPPAWMEYADMIADDPLLGVLMGAPHEVIMPDGCSADRRRESSDDR